MAGTDVAQRTARYRERALRSSVGGSPTGLDSAANLIWALRLGALARLARPITPDEMMVAKLRYCMTAPCCSMNGPAHPGMMPTMQLDPPAPLTSGSRSRNSRLVKECGPPGATPMPRGSRWDGPEEGITQCLDSSWLQDCRNGESNLTKLQDRRTGLLPQQRKPHGIQDDVKVLQLVDERHSPLLQGVVHHGIACGTGKEDHTVL